jgi:hypothetical protein
VNGNLNKDGSIEEGKWGGEAKDYLAGVFEGSVHSAHSNGVDSVRSVGSKCSFCRITRDVYSRRC